MPINPLMSTGQLIHLGPDFPTSHTRNRGTTLDLILGNKTIRNQSHTQFNNRTGVINGVRSHTNNGKTDYMIHNQTNAKNTEL